METKNPPPEAESLEEDDSSKEKRRELLRALQEFIGTTVVAYFTSHKYPVTIDQTDADTLEELLRNTEIRNGLCLLLDTPGGDGVAAERIVRTCRVYSKDRFEVFIARRAKSAGTIIAMGADKILMGETSALGRIDPQIVVKESDGTRALFPAHVVVTSYDDLLSKAVDFDDGREVYLRQLAQYDNKQIEAIRRQFRMAEDIAVKCLKQGMLADDHEDEIRKKVTAFLTPSVTKGHSRDIYFEEARRAGLNIELVTHDSSLWKITCDYYSLAWDFVATGHCKLMESVEGHFSLPWPVQSDQDG